MSAVVVAVVAETVASVHPYPVKNEITIEVACRESAHRPVTEIGTLNVRKNGNAKRRESETGSVAERVVVIAETAMLGTETVDETVARTAVAEIDAMAATDETIATGEMTEKEVVVLRVGKGNAARTEGAAADCILVIIK